MTQKGIGSEYYKRYLINDDYLFDIYFSEADKELVKKCETSEQLIDLLVSQGKIPSDSGIIPNKEETHVKTILFALQPKVYFGELFYNAYLKEDDYINGVYFTSDNIQEIRKAISNEGLIHALKLQHKIDYTPKYSESEATLASIAKQIAVVPLLSKSTLVKIGTLVGAIMITATLFTLKLVHHAF